MHSLWEGIIEVQIRKASLSYHHLMPSQPNLRSHRTVFVKVKRLKRIILNLLLPRWQNDFRWVRITCYRNLDYKNSLVTRVRAIKWSFVFHQGRWMHAKYVTSEKKRTYISEKLNIRQTIVSSCGAYRDWFMFPWLPFTWRVVCLMCEAGKWINLQLEVNCNRVLTEVKLTRRYKSTDYTSQ